MIPRPSDSTEDQHNDIEDTHICEMTPDLLIFGGNVSVFLCIMETDICPDRHHETRDDQQEDGYLIVIVEDTLAPSLDKSMKFIVNLIQQIAVRHKFVLLILYNTFISVGR